MAKGNRPSGSGGGGAAKVTTAQSLMAQYEQRIEQADSMDELNDIVEEAANAEDADGNSLLTNDQYQSIYEKALRKIQTGGNETANETASLNNSAQQSAADDIVGQRYAVQMAYPGQKSYISRVPALAKLQQSINDAPIGTTVASMFKDGSVRMLEKTSDTHWQLTDVFANGKTSKPVKYQGLKLMQMMHVSLTQGRTSDIPESYIKAYKK